MPENTIRVMEEKVLRIEWGGKEFTVAAKPFSQIQDVLRLIDAVKADSTGEGIVSLFTDNLKYLLESLRFFLAIPVETKDDWIKENLTMQRLKWLWGIIREVNNLEFIESFFSNVPLLMELMEAGKAATRKKATPSRGPKRPSA